MTSLREAWQISTPTGNGNPAPRPSAPVEMGIAASAPKFTIGTPTYTKSIPQSFTQWSGAGGGGGDTSYQPGPTPEEIDHMIKAEQKQRDQTMLYSIQGIVTDSEAYLQTRINALKQNLDEMQEQSIKQEPPLTKQNLNIVFGLLGVLLLLIIILFCISTIMQRKSFVNVISTFENNLKNLTLQQIRIDTLHKLLR